MDDEYILQFSVECVDFELFGSIPVACLPVDEDVILARGQIVPESKIEERNALGSRSRHVDLGSVEHKMMQTSYHHLRNRVAVLWSMPRHFLTKRAVLQPNNGRRTG